MNDDMGRVRLVRDLVRTGVSHNVLAKGRRSGSWTQVRRGAVVPGDLSEDERMRHRELIAATVPALVGGSFALSHVSAAVLLGMPLMNQGLDSVWITRVPGQGRSSHRRPQLVSRVCGLEDDELVEVNGLPLTCPERVALDLAREFGFVTGVMNADSVLHAGGSRSFLLELAERGAGRPGNKVARRVAEFSDALPESPGESMMRASLEMRGCPPPALQYVVRTADGQVIARCDFGWPEHGVVGEYDGRVKYGRLLKPGQSVSDVVVAEKEREGRIMEQGLRVIRFCAADLRRPDLAAGRLNRALLSGSTALGASPPAR